MNATYFAGGQAGGRPFLSGPLDVIELRQLRTNCIVGVYPEERRETQILEVDLALFLDTREAAAGAGLAKSLDYARLAGELRFLLESCRFRLLETAAEALCSYILAPPTDDLSRAQIEAASVRLTKPGALGGAAIPSLEIHRRREEMKYGREEKSFGRVDVLHESQGCGIYRLRIAPGREIPCHVHEVMEERELILGPGLLLQGRQVKPGQAFAWPARLPHRYENHTEIEQTILCVNRPAFLPEDEVEVPVPAEYEWIEPTSYYPEAG